MTHNSREVEEYYKKVDAYFLVEEVITKMKAHTMWRDNEQEMLENRLRELLHQQLQKVREERDTYWKEQIKKTKDEWYEVGYREGGDSKRIDIEILKEDWKERVVDSKRFFIAVEEDNITIRPVVRSDLDQILDNLK